MAVEVNEVLEEVKRIPVMEDVPEDQLVWLVDHGQCRSYQPGEYIFQPGDCIDRLIIILKGSFLIRVKQGSQFRMLGKVGAHEISGALPYSRAKTAIGYGETAEDSWVFSLDNTHFREMIRDHHELTTVFVHEMSSRIRKFTKQQQQNDKMMSLGKLSAGLAHELNNPSAAVIRGARELVKHLKLVPDKFKDVIKIRVTDEQVDEVNRVIFDHLEVERPILSMMERAEMEDEIMDWLDDHDISEEEELTEAFLDYGFSPDQLDQIADIIPPEYLEPVVHWVAQNLVTEKLVQDIGDASTRINELVSSIKSYTHMDQAPEKKRVNIHDGLRSTITMLAHKIRKNNVKVEPDWDEGIAEPKILVSEMNQVWTNLIDNALDAMEDSDGKELVIRTKEEHGFIRIEIQDSGSGIPEEALDHIFDPFFTTKDVGKGTGIGLDIVWQIVTQHNGKISVDSEPGKTVFTIVIPID